MSTAGVPQALASVCHLLIEPGDAELVENPMSRSHGVCRLDRS